MKTTVERNKQDPESEISAEYVQKNPGIYFYSDDFYVVTFSSSRDDRDMVSLFVDAECGEVDEFNPKAWDRAMFTPVRDKLTITFDTTQD